MIGPNLYGVLGRKIASHEGYEYSDALKAKEGDWDYEKINHMIENPDVFVPGTKMALFPGLPDAKQRADVLVFLRTKNDNPPPLPEAKPPRKSRPARRSRGEAKRVAARRRRGLPRADRQGRSQAGRSRHRACARSATASRRAARPSSVPISMAWSGARSPRSRASTTRPRSRRMRATGPIEKLDAWLKNPAGLRAGDDDGLPRRGGRQEARRHHRLPADERATTPAPLPEAAAAHRRRAQPRKTHRRPSAGTGSRRRRTAGRRAPAAETPAPSAEAPVGRDAEHPG